VYNGKFTTTLLLSLPMQYFPKLQQKLKGSSFLWNTLYILWFCDFYSATVSM